jgi:hypothetical protein
MSENSGWPCKGEVASAWGVRALALAVFGGYRLHRRRDTFTCTAELGVPTDPAGASVVMRAGHACSWRRAAEFAVLSGWPAAHGQRSCRPGATTGRRPLQAVDLRPKFNATAIPTAVQPSRPRSGRYRSPSAAPGRSDGEDARPDRSNRHDRGHTNHAAGVPCAGAGQSRGRLASDSLRGNRCSSRLR